MPHNETAAQPSIPSAPEPSPPQRLRELARAVERLATHGRLDPEAVYIAKATLAQQMRRLAAELEGRAA